MIFLFFLPSAYADPVPSSFNASGIVFPLRDTPIKLTNENLTVMICHGITKGIHATAGVKCNLTFDNPTFEEKTITLAIPLSNDNTPFIIVDSKKDGLSLCSKRTGCNFSIALKSEDYNKDIVKFYEQYGIKVYKIDELFEKELPEGWDYLALYNLTLKPREIKTVILQYDDVLGLGLGDHEFKYLLSTVKFWNSTPNIDIHVYIDPNIVNVDLMPEYKNIKSGKILDIKPKPDKIEVVNGNILHIYWHNATQDIVIKYELKAGNKWDYPLSETNQAKTNQTPMPITVCLLALILALLFRRWCS